MKLTRASKAAFYKRLRAATPTVEKHLAAANSKSADEIVSMAQRLVAVEEGDLRNSIRRESGNLPTTAVVLAGGPTTTKPVREGADASYDYALAVEFGTQRQPAQPFFWPSVRANRSRYRGRAGRALRQAIKEAGFNG